MCSQSFMRLGISQDEGSVQYKELYLFVECSIIRLLKIIKMIRLYINIVYWHYSEFNGILVMRNEMHSSTSIIDWMKVLKIFKCLPNYQKCYEHCKQSR